VNGLDLEGGLNNLDLCCQALAGYPISGFKDGRSRKIGDGLLKRNGLCMSVIICLSFSKSLRTVQFRL